MISQHSHISPIGFNQGENAAFFSMQKKKNLMSHNEINRKKFELKYNLDKVSFTFALIKKNESKIFREPRSSLPSQALQGY